MFKVSVMYPYKEDARFDLDYYQNNHMRQVEKLLKPYGLVKTTVEKGISGERVRLHHMFVLVVSFSRPRMVMREE